MDFETFSKTRSFEPLYINQKVVAEVAEPFDREIFPPFDPLELWKSCDFSDSKRFQVIRRICPAG